MGTRTEGLKESFDLYGVYMGRWILGEIDLLGVFLGLHL